MPQLCTLPPSTPAELLAWDEALLDATEAGGPEALWFWEAAEPFVVVGYGQEIAREVDEAACGRRGVPVLRRCSGGGTVVQGRGCLNYGLTLRIEEGGPLATITGTNAWIMERNRRALTTVLDHEMVVRGHTDLALVTAGGEKKFSGNAQRRKRTALLFHGTILLDFNLELIAELLRFPSAQPDYRRNRSHLDFIANTGLAAGAAIRALSAEWGAESAYPALPVAGMQTALNARYMRDDWNHRR
ncbi:MAG TPA: lipoate--protein ligase family protein [Candidatus Limnocylindria bacterium]|jgi:lipoate-protein ligase A|nr:lipoate--protein ligase family protein [Candidatus Limnocylindria bacterium]